MRGAEILINEAPAHPFTLHSPSKSIERQPRPGAPEAHRSSARSSPRQSALSGPFGTDPSRHRSENSKIRTFGCQPLATAVPAPLQKYFMSTPAGLRVQSPSRLWIFESRRLRVSALGSFRMSPPFFSTCHFSYLIFPLTRAPLHCAHAFDCHSYMLQKKNARYILCIRTKKKG
ncbi:hypothetical protein CROQUDRAFT_179024 [Cronartium quercuum f. sp. fusiforme G11]|uniref:Uncharacterized protein n=1 Tax=Cronartium quercuum f. sp. fusiforme G11 TaxID=708437 RepID=A0A9P6NUH8_9BASI|nr:hypothetical protein CROQUDRAFT_179024 [Cronartium quercuum f. sp. fusiforme G11]